MIWSNNNRYIRILINYIYTKKKNLVQVKYITIKTKKKKQLINPISHPCTRPRQPSMTLFSQCPSGPMIRCTRCYIPMLVIELEKKVNNAQLATYLFNGYRFNFIFFHYYYQWHLLHIDIISYTGIPAYITHTYTILYLRYGRESKRGGPCESLDRFKKIIKNVFETGIIFS